MTNSSEVLVVSSCFVKYSELEFYELCRGEEPLITCDTYSPTKSI